MACLYITTIDGTFMGGLDGAQPGIVMEVHPAIGDFYRQEFDVGNAEDFAEVVGLSDAVTVPYGPASGWSSSRSRPGSSGTMAPILQPPGLTGAASRWRDRLGPERRQILPGPPRA